MLVEEIFAIAIPCNDFCASNWAGISGHAVVWMFVSFQPIQSRFGAPSAVNEVSFNVFLPTGSVTETVSVCQVVQLPVDAKVRLTGTNAAVLLERLVPRTVVPA